LRIISAISSRTAARGVIQTASAAGAAHGLSLRDQILTPKRTINLFALVVDPTPLALKLR
ncbi:MAG: hypothetical protein RR784_00715, partial [Burkholderiaceae bacterium]